MTREEAFKYLMNDWFKALGGQVCVNGDVADRFLEALGLAISALREQEELARNSHDVVTHVQNGWVSVEDRLPTKEDECNGIVGIVNGYNGKITFTDAYLFLRYDFDENAWWSEDYNIEGCKVTHWMSLPLEPPKEA